MKMQKIEGSTHIAAIGHDGKETMHVQYFSAKGNGATYAHSPVSAEDHAKIMKRIADGESAGKIIRSLEPRGVRLPDERGFMAVKMVCLALLLAVTSALLLSGCSNNYRMEQAQAAFPGCEIAFTPDQHSYFIVRKPDNSIWYVRCDNPFSGSITSKSMILSPKK